MTEQYLDSTGIFKDAVISIMATVARQENVRRSERTKAGLARVRAAGVKLGRPRAVLDLRCAKKLRARGETLRTIAKKMRISPALLCLRLKV